MPRKRLSDLLEQVRRTMLAQGGSGFSDRTLLESFVQQHDQAAFSAIVRRHGPLVWSVCQRILGNHHDSEDAFQATFLVLRARPAPSRTRELLANWLFGVALRTALSAGPSALASSSARNKSSPYPNRRACRIFGTTWSPFSIRSCPVYPRYIARYLSYAALEGKSRKQAAEELGVPEGTVSSRLTRARNLLARRLAHRGLPITAVALAAVLPANGAASVPPLALSTTIQALSALATGQAAGTVSIKVIALTEGVIKAMYLGKIMKIGVCVLVVAMAMAGGGVVYQQAATAQGKVKGLNPAAKAEIANLQAEVAKLRSDLDSALKEIDDLKAGSGRADQPKDQGPTYRGRPIRFWLEQFKDTDPKFRADAVEALGYLAERDKNLIAVIDSAFKDKSSVVNKKAFNALLLLGRGSLRPQVMEILLEILKENSPNKTDFTVNAAYVLAAIGPKAKAAVPLLTEVLKGDNWDTRLASVYALGMIGPEAKSALPALVDAFGEAFKGSGPDFEHRRKSLSKR